MPARGGEQLALQVQDEVGVDGRVVDVEPVEQVECGACLQHHERGACLLQDGASALFGCHGSGDRLVERREGFRPAAGGLYPAKEGEHRRPDLPRGWLGQRTLEQPDRGLGRASVSGTECGREELLDRPRIRARQRLGEVGGDLLRAFAAVRQDACGAGVRERTVCRRDVGPHGFAKHRMYEPDACAGDEDVGGRQQVGGCDGVALGELSQPGGVVQVGVTEHRDCPGEPLRSIARRRESPQHEPANGVRRDPPELYGVVVQAAPPAGLKCCQELAQQKGVSSGGAVEPVDKALLDLVVEHRAGHRRDRVLAERGQGQVAVGQPSQCGCDVPRRVAASRERHQQWYVVESGRQHPQHVQGREVRPMRIVHSHQDRGRRCQLRGEPCEAVADRRSGTVVWQDHRCFHEQVGGERAGPGPEDAPGVRRQGAYGRTQQLQQHPEGLMCSEFLSVRPVDREPPRSPPRRDLVQQARFADPGRSADQQRSGPARRSLGQFRLRGRQLLVALQERRYERLAHTMIMPWPTHGPRRIGGARLPIGGARLPHVATVRRFAPSAPKSRPGPVRSSMRS
nr:hypothetical protein [Georgenia sp. SYP-B2076]